MEAVVIGNICAEELTSPEGRFDNPKKLTCEDPDTVPTGKYSFTCCEELTSPDGSKLSAAEIVTACPV